MLEKFLLTGLAAGALLGQSLSEGVGQYKSGRLAAAERTLRAAAEGPAEDQPAANYYLALAQIEQEKLADAESTVNRLAEECPDSELSRIARARLSIQRKQFSEAETLLSEAEEINPGSSQIAYVRGVLDVARKEYRSGARHLERALEREPDLAYAHYYAGLAYNGLKQLDKVVEHFQAFLRLAPQAPEAKKVQTLLRALK